MKFRDISLAVIIVIVFFFIFYCIAYWNKEN